MALLTFEELHAEVAAFHAAEEARNAPAARACRALETLREALAEVSPIERAELVCEMEGLLNDTDVVVWGHVGAASAREG